MLQRSKTQQELVHQELVSRMVLRMLQHLDFEWVFESCNTRNPLRETNSSEITESRKNYLHVLKRNAISFGFKRHCVQ